MKKLISAALVAVLAGCTAQTPAPTDFPEPTETENVEQNIEQEKESSGMNLGLEDGTLYEKAALTASKRGNVITLAGKGITVVYDTAAGLYDIAEKGAQTAALKGVYAETTINGETVQSKNLSRGENFFKAADITDEFGVGVKISLRNEGAVAIVQNFYFYESLSYALFEAVIEGGDIKTNYIAPIAAGDGDLLNEVLAFPETGDPRFLFVPFDNDAFVRYNSSPLIAANESYEVTAVFDNESRYGFVTGSVTHDTWKTGIRVKQGRFNKTVDFRVFGGITSGQTRDSLPHGFVSGETVTSPRVFFGFFDDWRDGMEAYGAANGVIAPPLKWDDGVPFGWNSWSAVADKVSYAIYTQASDFVKDNLQNSSFNNNGIVYINFDSFWDNLTVDQIMDAAKKVKENGQRPGIYYTPFTYWGGSNTARTVEGTNNLYSYDDIVLKDENGRIVPAIDGGVCIDPTHPANVQRVNYQLQKFLDWGFEYVKMDFMSHGAVEGVHYDKNITTGIAAYNFGMQSILDFLGDKITNQEFFISLSIAPIFPAQYAHGRRISCDIFGTIDNAEYMLNSLTYGWWLNRAVYPFNDPDHIVVYNSYNHREEIMYNEGLTRYVSSAIAGTFLIDSDDFRQKEARERAVQILTNEKINALAAEGISFRPVEGNTADRACDTFVRESADGLYLAVFNFSASAAKEMTVDLARIGLSAGDYYAENLINGKTETISGASFKIRLNRAEPKLFKITKK